MRKLLFNEALFIQFHRSIDLRRFVSHKGNSVVLPPAAYHGGFNTRFAENMQSASQMTDFCKLEECSYQIAKSNDFCISEMSLCL